MLKPVALIPTEAVFENPQHDFPKRIIYRKSGDNTLTTTVDAGEGTKAISVALIRVIGG